MNGEYIQVASDPVIKDKKDTELKSFDYTEEEQKEANEVKLMLDTDESYQKARASKEREWSESYKMYMSYIDISRNPFLSNLFIPKTHEAVELLAAFLIGTNQSINATPENNGDSMKATVAGKYLDFLWRKVLKARLKILTWIKQGEVFGNGVMKVGWDSAEKKPWMANTAIEDIRFDYYCPDLQDSEWIFHEVRREKSEVMADEKYSAMDSEGKLIRNDVVIGGTSPYLPDSKYKFSSADKSLTGQMAENKVVILEGWCKSQNKVISIAPTSIGWRRLRKVDNPNYHVSGTEKLPFRPFAKLRFKTSPLANRAYDMGAVYPTVKIQKAFNDVMNQYFDNVVLINNAMWIKRRGARINPAELVRRPGGVITVGDINNDLRSDVVGDVKSSLLDMLNRLDGEFQQASMVVNLLKGIDNGASNTATEAQLGQQNVQTLLEMIDENIGDALSELGSMVLSIALNNAEGNQTVKMFESDNAVGMLEFDPKNIQGLYDVQIKADRSAGTSKVVRQKQLLDFLNISTRPEIVQRFPNLSRKTLEKWLEEAGFHDTEYFFEGEQKPQVPEPESKGSSPAQGIDQMLNEASAMQGNLPQGSGLPTA